jgi:dTDP-4-amino-4,6-dideoxygalactose transaminase
MKIPFVDLKKQYISIKDDIDNAIEKVLSETAFIGGSYVESFEKSFAKFCGVKHCIGVGNGTDAIFIALKAMGIKPNDEVITVANSFIATSEAITLAGAKVVFVDINPKTYTIDVTKIENKITKNTKVIIPVHLYGQPADMDPILDLAKKYNLKVLEDSAQGHASSYKGRRIGSIGDVTTFSFYPGKNLGAYGDAGAIVTNNEELAIEARKFANHGRIEKYNHEIEGINSRMDGLQAAILDVKLKHLEDWSEKRRKNASFYNEYLKGIDGLSTPYELDFVKAVYHLYVIRVKKEVRKSLMDFLNLHGIATGIHYPIALPMLRAYSYLGHTENDFPESVKVSEEIISLPMFAELEEKEIAYIAEKIKDFFK